MAVGRCLMKCHRFKWPSLAITADMGCRACGDRQTDRPTDGHKDGLTSEMCSGRGRKLLY